MATDQRLRRLITDEIGECCDADLDDRLQTLERLVESTPTHHRKRDISVLSSLANDTRYTILRYLAAAEKDLCVCELDPILDVSESAISHALSDLYNSGLVEKRKQGRWRYYQATDRAAALLDALDETREATP